MEQSVEVGDVWIAKDQPELEIKVFVVSGDTVICKLTKDWGGYVRGELVTYTKDTLFRIYAKEVDKVYFDGYQEGYKFGHLDGKKEGYESGYADCSEKLHSIFGERELEIEKDAFQEGCAHAYSELHAPTTEQERQLQEKAWDEGYVSAIEDYLSQGGEFVGNVGCYVSCYEFGAVDAWEHTPNEETQEAMQEVLGKGEWKSTRCPDEGSEGFLKDYNIEGIREDKKHKYPHYFKNVSHLDWVDVYQINKLFPVKDDSDCILHARKKLLVCGGRGGGKDMLKDVKEAYDTLHRYLEIEGHLDD